MNNLSNIKVSCSVRLEDTVVSVEEFKSILEKGSIALDQFKNKEISLIVGEDADVIAYGNIIFQNGRYGMQITKIL